MAFDFSDFWLEKKFKIFQKKNIFNRDIIIFYFLKPPQNDLNFIAISYI